MPKDKLISILLAAHNRANLISETLESIRAQTYQNWRCIIIDDHSGDETSHIIKEFVAKDSRFSYYLKTENYTKGLPGTRNQALDVIKEFQPEFIQFFDDDDLMHPEKLAMQMAELNKVPKSQFVLCGRRNFENRSEIKYDEVQDYNTSGKLTVGEAFLIGKLRFGVQVPLFRYEYIKDFRFDEDLEYAEDWVYFSKILLLSKPVFSCLPKTLFYRRKHLLSMTETGVENHKKRKSEIVGGIKIFDFLIDNKLQTKTTLFYFTRTFLLYQYDSSRIKLIGGTLKNNPQFSGIDYFRFKLAVTIHWLSRKTILRLSKFN